MNEFVFRVVFEVPEFPNFWQWLGWLVIVFVISFFFQPVKG
jgi:hypothetical protein